MGYSEKMAIKQHGMAETTALLDWSARKQNVLHIVRVLFSIPTSFSISLSAGEHENSGATHNTHCLVPAVTLQQHQFILWMCYFSPEATLIVTAST